MLDRNNKKFFDSVGMNMLGLETSEYQSCVIVALVCGTKSHFLEIQAAEYFLAYPLFLSSITCRVNVLLICLTTGN